MKQRNLQWIRFTVLGLSLLLLEACGQAACSSEFVSDYNEIAHSFKSNATNGDVSRPLALAQQFKTKYEGVVCKANMESPYGLEPTETTIDASKKMDEIISMLNKISEEAK